MGLYVILMGVQGAGKGVQAGFISETYNIPHVSTGDLFRAMKTREDELAKKVQSIMAAGQLVSDEVTNEIVDDRLSQDDAQNGVILDGYPRNQNQAEFLAQLLAKKGEKVNAVLLLDLDLFTAFKRAFGRVTAEDGGSYNIYFKNEGLDISFEEDPNGNFPPRIVATKDGETLKRRPDDASAAAVIKRIDTYLENTQPLIDYYSDAGLLVKVDADQAIDAVSQRIKSILDDAQ
jgi:adenylate kinase